MEGVRGWLMEDGERQVVFFDIEPVGKIPPHSHGAQWGVVVEGSMELRIGNETRTYRRGDSYHIPAGVEHEARFDEHFRAIDVFDEPARYSPKKS
ncbi:MAG: cupin domain-containing protein [Deltaproteobacteria bacterium]|nr:MAG: cupin domain-containing protein [Deltaproteobacteria bacterium]